MMDGPRVELSLTLLSAADQRPESDVSVIARRKRKQTWDKAVATPSAAMMSTRHQPSTTTTTTASVDLQLHDPLPLDWEQCLDLQSGRMYYMNRKTLKKSWSQPKEQELDLELNIYPPATPDHQHNELIPNPSNPTSPAAEDQPAKQTPPSSNRNSSAGSSSSSTSNMVAVVCINCHLLVMLCRSSPSCPNCKHMNSLPLPTASAAPAAPPPPAIEPPKTLSLLH